MTLKAPWPLQATEISRRVISYSSGFRKIWPALNDYGVTSTMPPCKLLLRAAPSCWLSPDRPSMDTEVRDINGAAVRVGTWVRVLRISDVVLSQLSESEAEAAMEGDVLEVQEIDEWGGAWVEKSWREADGTVVSHALGLGPEQMEAVEDPGDC